MSRGSQKSHPLFEGSSWPTARAPEGPARCRSCTASVRRLDLILRTRDRCDPIVRVGMRLMEIGVHDLDLLALNAESVDGGSAQGGAY